MPLKTPEELAAEAEIRLEKRGVQDQYTPSFLRIDPNGVISYEFEGTIKARAIELDTSLNASKGAEFDATKSLEWHRPDNMAVAPDSTRAGITAASNLLDDTQTTIWRLGKPDAAFQPGPNPTYDRSDITMDTDDNGRWAISAEFEHFTFLPGGDWAVRRRLLDDRGQADYLQIENQELSVVGGLNYSLGPRKWYIYGLYGISFINVPAGAVAVVDVAHGLNLLYGAYTICGVPSQGAPVSDMGTFSFQHIDSNTFRLVTKSTAGAMTSYNAYFWVIYARP